MKTKILISTLYLCAFLIGAVYSQNDVTASIQKAREAKNLEFDKAGTSPLTTAQIQKFTGLSYFAIDSKAIVNAVFKPADPQSEVSLGTTAGTKIKLIKYGTVTFTYAGKSYTLAVYQNNNLPEFGSNNNQLFIPFADPTNGKETFSKGRYLPISLPSSGNTVTLDFNLAENPYNAYNKALVSVVPPPGNELLAPVNSGERKYEDRSN